MPTARALRVPAWAVLLTQGVAVVLWTGSQVAGEPARLAFLPSRAWAQRIAETYQLGIDTADETDLRSSAERDRLADVDERNRRQNLKLIRVRSMGVAVTQTIFGFGVPLVIFMASRESLEGNLTAGQFISFFSAMMLMLQPVRRITNVNATLQRGVAGAHRVVDLR